VQAIPRRAKRIETFMLIARMLEVIAEETVNAVAAV
jgi:hypothetical protein